MSKNLLSAAVVFGALRVKRGISFFSLKHILATRNEKLKEHFLFSVEYKKRKKIYILEYRRELKLSNVFSPSIF